jgi:hypothetical protein
MRFLARGLTAAGISVVVAHKFSTVLETFLCDNVVARAILCNFFH